MAGFSKAWPAALVLVAGMTLAAALHADPGRQALPSILGDERLDEARDDLEALFSRVAKKKLPVDLFEAKVREGLVKKVDSDRILAALEKLEQRCLSASKLLSSAGLKKSAASIQYTAELLGQGMAHDDANRLLKGLARSKVDEAGRGKGLLAAVMTMERGTSGSEAVNIVLDIVEESGTEGLDAFIKTNIGKPIQDEEKGEGTSHHKDKKAKKIKKKHTGKGKAKGKSAKPHGK